MSRIQAYPLRYQVDHIPRRVIKGNAAQSRDGGKLFGLLCRQFRVNAKIVKSGFILQG